MKAVVVAGGRGERLRPITDLIPKPMVQVHGIPVLEHIVNLLKTYGIREYIFALCYLPRTITDYFGTGKKFGITIKYTFEDPQIPMGTAGAIRDSKQFINDTFIVTYADILRNLNIKSMIKLHHEKSSFSTINVYKRLRESTKSIVEFNTNKRITKFVERPDKNIIAKKYIWSNGSFYIFNPEIFNAITKNKPSDFGREIFPKLLLERKNLFAFPTQDYLIDIGNMISLKKAEVTFNQKKVL